MSKQTRILVVEDDDALRYTVSRLLKLPGYEVLEASSGDECLRVVREQRPDLVLLDVRLPDLSGREVCQRIKSDPELASTFVLHLTGVETSRDSEADALEAGADGYLTKPLHERALLAHIRAMLRIRSAEGALRAQQREEMQSLGQRPFNPGATSAKAPLSQSAPPTFEAMVARYGELMDHAVTGRGKPALQRTLTEGLSALAVQMAALELGARDVVELHSAVLAQRTADIPLLEAQAYIEEGRLLALELMGHLLTQYRNRLVR